jgi:hypothetical protein
MAKNNSWDYTSSEDESESAGPSTPAAGAVNWTASEYIDHSQGPAWYAGLAVVSLLLASVLYFLTKDKFTVGAILIVGLITGVAAARKPQQIPYEISDSGVKIGEKAYGYRNFRSFSVLNEGGMNSISLMPLKRFMPRLSLFYDPADEEKIIDILSENLPYEEHKIDQIERISRFLRF